MGINTTRSTSHDLPKYLNDARSSHVLKGVLQLRTGKIGTNLIIHFAYMIGHFRRNAIKQYNPRIKRTILCG
ncbi:hypothetical protein TP41_15360 [Xanthomonas euvesicatoria pv. citrumelonis]|nr:hypothetical protein TP41_15360 [Xanthomonas euvesicatoria pv. citrumelonis]